MVELAHPWLLLLLPLPLLVRWLVPPHREQLPATRIPFFAEIAASIDQRPEEGSVVVRRRPLQMVFLLSIWCLVVAALADPQWVGEAVVREEPARDMMLAIDLSGSMDTVDFPDDAGKRERRLRVVQRVVDRFVADREGDRIGLIVFGTRPYLQLPFTRDLDTARQLVELMEVSMAGPQTAIGDAIGLAIKAFEESEVEQRVLILLSDGNDTASKMTPLNAAAIARSKGLAIYTIGIGDPEASGEDRVDFATLEEVAKRADGAFFTADDENGLSQVYRRIDGLAPQQVRSQSYRPRVSLVHWPAGAGLFLGLVATGIGWWPGRGRRVL